MSGATRALVVRPLRRLAAVGILAALVAGVTAVAVLPVIDRVRRNDDAVAEQRMLLGRLQAHGQGGGRAVTAAADALQQSRQSLLTIEGETDAIRFASLQSMVGDIANAAGSKLRSARTLPARDKADVRMIGLQVQLSASLAQIQRLIVDLESHRPYLMIEAVQLTPMPGAFDPASAAPGQIEARIDILAPTTRAKG